ncbi:hypothetical protein FZC79_15375 [Rossellomorea vietnamensis]|uniref:Uncharacterized protein n=2 Tax=Rossellomorea TaxID=2837508 RepID=A0A5D4KC01_9BACI|nr:MULTISPECIES: hypothetical protein [Rossellomorea]TYR74195.1 hypothetical protein FZC79_15375 [Rossellomorea vietnamensis]TYS79717.1 hypothetical protein FZC80_08715 [Rossellomorea aquimaris]
MSYLCIIEEQIILTFNLLKGGIIIKRKLSSASLIIFLALSGCTQPESKQELAVEKIEEGEVVETVHTITNQEEIESVMATLENEKWTKVDLYSGTDFMFSVDNKKVDVHIHSKNNSVEMFRQSEDGNERAVILHEEAEVFYELLTGDSLENFEG